VRGLSHEHIESLLDAMRSAGCAPADGSKAIIADGERHRYRLDGDPKTKRRGWFCIFDDDRPAGAFGAWIGADKTKFTWKAGGDIKPLTQAERAEFARQKRERDAARAAKDAAEYADQALLAKRMLDGAKSVAAHPYLERKGLAGLGEHKVSRWLTRGDDGETIVEGSPTLLIPLRTIASKETVAVQGITSNGVKLYQPGARRPDQFAVIGTQGRHDGRLLVLIGEGYATGASVNLATGLGVVVALDAGHLKPVAAAFRAALPSARIIILADDDRWTTGSDGVPINPGLNKARDAAKAVDGEVIAPTFTSEALAEARALRERLIGEGKPAKELPKPCVDWNDLHAAAGLDEVRRQIMAVVHPMPELAPAPQPDPGPPPIESADDFGPMDVDAGEPDEPAPAAESDEEEIENPYFTVRGHDRTHLYIYQHRLKLVVSRGLSDWSEAALTSLAPLHWWELNFPGEKGMSKKMAVNWLQRMGEQRGFFDPESIRGRGAWRDDGRFVYHFGHKVWVDGQVIEVQRIDSNFIYEQGRRMRLPADQPMASAEGKKLFEAFQMFSWNRSASAILLAGWAALAPVGGALRWRPHVWITGGAGSGKTTILNFVHWLMNGTNIYAQGNSTEAGIRQTLRTDSRAVIFDESEQNNERETLRMQNVLSLIRQSSTESDAQTLKGTQGGDAMHFVVRSMFCLGSIQVGLKQQADMERISVLSLKSKKERLSADEERTATEAWGRISGGLTAVRADPELPAKLIRRSLQLLPITIQNVEVFAQAAAEKFGSQRDGDQYGTLLAGAWSLVSTKVATLDEARAMIGRYDWSDYLEASETEESDKALAALLGSLVRVKSQEVSIFELVQRAAGVECEMRDVSGREADSVLRRHGLMLRWGDTKRVEDAVLLVATKHGQLERLMEKTPYAADLKGQLARLPGADKHPVPEKFLGVPSRAIRLPLAMVLAGVSDIVITDDNFDDIPF